MLNKSPIKRHGFSRICHRYVVFLQSQSPVRTGEEKRREVKFADTFSFAKQRRNVFDDESAAEDRGKSDNITSHETSLPERGAGVSMSSVLDFFISILSVSE